MHLSFPVSVDIDYLTHSSHPFDKSHKSHFLKNDLPAVHFYCNAYDIISGRACKYQQFLSRRKFNFFIRYLFSFAQKSKWPTFSFNQILRVGFVAKLIFGVFQPQIEDSRFYLQNNCKGILYIV